MKNLLLLKPAINKKGHLSMALPASAKNPNQDKAGGEGGIRTPDREFKPDNGFRDRRFRPLSHLSGSKKE